MPLVIIITRWNKKMVLIYSDGRILDDEEEDDASVGNKSELMLHFGKMRKKHPLILDAKLTYRNNPSIPYYIRFLNINKDPGHEHRESKGLGLPCRRTSLASIPIGLTSSEILIESLSRCRRTRSANDLGDLFVEHTPALAGTGDVTVMARPFLKSSLFFQLGAVDAAIRPSRATSFSFSFSPMKSSDRTASPLGAPSPLSSGPGFVAMSPVSQISELKRSESLLVPCSSSNSNCSYQSNSPSLNVSKGTIYCTRKNGSIKLLFREDDDKGRVFMSNVHKIEASVDMAMDYLYTFRSMTGNKASEYVGMMRVVSSLILNPDRSRSIETEFVLLGSEEHSNEAQNHASGATKMQGLSKKVAKMFRSSSSWKHKDARKIGDFAPSKPMDGEGSESANCPESSRRSSLELAAVVVRRSYVKNEAETGGWGLKFLDRAETGHADTACSSIDVLIPAGFHGGPVTGDGGPSALTERWRSGGRCDCGGWDVGCPLTVLHDGSSTAQIASPIDNLHEDGKTVDLFIEGANHGEPALKMVVVADGVFAVYFRPTLSALQAFSVGAAIIHSRTPELHPRL